MQSTRTETQQGSARDLELVIKEGLVTQAMAVLTGGTFLVAYALKLGATDFQIGLMAAIPLLANVLQIASIYLVPRVGSRKKVVVVCSAIGRSVYLPVALLPFVGLEKNGIWVILVALCLQHGMGAISNGGWNSWMRDLIPSQQLGAFFSRRLRLSHIVAVTLSLGCAFGVHQVVTQYADYEVYSYALLFLGGAVLGLISVRMLARTPEPPVTFPRSNWLRMIRKPFRHQNFRNLMLYTASWNFAINLSVPFATVYMLKTLEISLPVVIGLTTLTQVANILFFKYWGRYADRYGNKAVLRLCVPLYLCCLLAWIYTGLPGSYSLTLPLLVVIHFVSGIATAGTGLASSSIGLKLAPKKDSVAYLSLLSFTNAIAAGLAPLLTGSLAFYFADKHMGWSLGSGASEVFLVHVQHWDFFFLFSFLFGWIAMYRLSRIKERGSLMIETADELRKVFLISLPIMRLLSTPRLQTWYKFREKKMARAVENNALETI